MTRRALRAAVVAAVALATVTVGPPAHAYRFDRAESVVVVPADGTTAESQFLTARGAIYEITVSGTFEYDALGRLADCGYHDTNAAVLGQQWEPGGPRLVFGGGGGCGSYTDTHTYRMTARGTGVRYAFRIEDPTGPADNAGALVVTVRLANDVDGDCRYASVAQPAAGVSHVSLVAEAHQTGTPETYAFTAFECVLYLDGAPVASVTSRAAGPAAGPATWTGVVPVGFLRACLRLAVEDLWGETVVERTPPCV